MYRQARYDTGTVFELGGGSDPCLRLRTEPEDPVPEGMMRKGLACRKRPNGRSSGTTSTCPSGPSPSTTDCTRSVPAP